MHLWVLGQQDNYQMKKRNILSDVGTINEHLEVQVGH